MPQIDNTLLALFLHSFDNARDTLEQVKDCPDNPFDRIDREVKGVTEGLLAAERTKVPGLHVSPLDWGGLADENC